MIPDYSYGMLYDHIPQTESERKDSMTVNLIALVVSLAFYIPCLVISQMPGDVKPEHALKTAAPARSATLGHHLSCEDDVSKLASPVDELP